MYIQKQAVSENVISYDDAERRPWCTTRQQNATAKGCLFKTLDVAIATRHCEQRSCLGYPSLTAPVLQ